MEKQLILLLIFGASSCFAKTYTPDWASLDSRPLPDWYDKAKIGIFMHSGVYSVPGVGSEWFWKHWKDNNNSRESQFMKANYKPDFTYQDFGKELTFEFFDANQFAKIVQDSGAKYIVFTSKHHDGFTNFDSKHTFGWNSLDIGPNRDIVGELRDAIKKTDVRFGLYHSLYEWFNPMYLSDKENKYTTKEYVEMKMKPELKDLITKYEPEVIFSDGDWEAYPDYWDSKEIIAWMYNSAPTKDTIVTNDRWGKNTRFHHGDYYSGPDRYNPGKLLNHKWEDAMTIDKTSWGFRRAINVEDVLTPKQMMTTIAEVISTGGNILVNVGPTKQGTICAIFQERLSQMGSWLKANGQAIYETKPWKHQNETITENIKVWYTSRPDLNEVYAILTDWPVKSSSIQLTLPQATKSTQVTMPCAVNPLKFEQQGKKLKIDLPNFNEIKGKCGNAGDWTYVIALKNVNAVH